MPNLCDRCQSDAIEGNPYCCSCICTRDIRHIIGCCCAWLHAGCSAKASLLELWALPSAHLAQGIRVNGKPKAWSFLEPHGMTSQLHHRSAVPHPAPPYFPPSATWPPSIAQCRSTHHVVIQQICRQKPALQQRPGLQQQQGWGLRVCESSFVALLLSLATASPLNVWMKNHASDHVQCVLKLCDAF